MADELVDVVDENDKIIGQEMKWICHEKGFWHRIAGVLLFNSEGKIWLQTRNKKKTGGGLLDFSASGHIGAGDSSLRGAYREMEEELGIKTNLKVGNIKIFEDYAYDKNSKVKHVINLFLGNYNGPFKIQEEELEDIQAYSTEDIKKFMKKEPPIMTEGLKLTLKEYFKQNDFQQ